MNDLGGLSRGLQIVHFKFHFYLVLCVMAPLKGSPSLRLEKLTGYQHNPGETPS